MTGAQMEAWAAGFDSWDVCDQVCMNLFDKTSFAPQKIAQWARRPEEFVKRAAFALIACLAWHDKKAVSWALRNTGKRNLNLNRAALGTVREIQELDSKAARWIAAQARRELERN